MATPCDHSWLETSCRFAPQVTLEKLHEFIRYVDDNDPPVIDIYIALCAASLGRSAPPELWAAGMWAMSIIYFDTSEVKRPHCSKHQDHLNFIERTMGELGHSMQFGFPYNDYPVKYWLARIAYGICPKPSITSQYILFTLIHYESRLNIDAAQFFVPAGQRRDLLTPMLEDPTLPPRARAVIAMELAEEHMGASGPTTAERCITFAKFAYDADPTYVRPATTIISIMVNLNITSMPLAARVQTKWGAAHRIITTRGPIREPDLDLALYYLSPDEIVDGLVDLGDVDGRIPAAEFVTRTFELRHDLIGCMVPVSRPLRLCPPSDFWTRRRHAAVDCRGGTHALFMCFMLGMQRLVDNGVIAATHLTLLEFTLEASWTFADTLAIWDN